MEHGALFVGTQDRSRHLRLIYYKELRDRKRQPCSDDTTIRHQHTCIGSRQRRHLKSDRSHRIQINSLWINLSRYVNTPRHRILRRVYRPSDARTDSPPYKNSQESAAVPLWNRKPRDPLLHARSSDSAVYRYCSWRGLDGDKDTQRWNYGYVVFVNGSPTYCKSKRQIVIALSTGYAEYVAMSACARDVSWIRNIYWEIAHHQPWVEYVELPETLIPVDITATISL